jgi:hypothetical protein
MRRPLLALAVTAAATWAAGTTASAQDELQALLDKATVYELAFIRTLENVVAEETYVQERSKPYSRRTLRSDFLFVRYPGLKQSMVLRDVFEVDGKMVRDATQTDRLMRLFTSPVPDPVARAREIAVEGARYNLSDVGTLNNPLIAMGFLQPENRSRFRFARGPADRSLGPTMRRVEFEEYQRPTVLRSNQNGNLESEGTIWIDETDGRVIRTSLRVGNLVRRPEIVTTYRRDPELGIDVPAEMRDSYPDGSGELTGVATYGRFRRFTVRTRETVRQP